MNQFFTETGYTDSEAMEKIRYKYGDNFHILSRKAVRLGGIFGFFQRDGYEYSGYISRPGVKKIQEQDERNRQEILNMTQGGGAMGEVLKELKDIKNQIAGHREETQPLHPSLEQLVALLEENEFSQEYTEQIVERLKREFSLEDLNQFPLLESSVAEWIGSTITELPEPLLSSKRIFVLVGPTGVGKTTTIAKLAAIYGRRIRNQHKALRVCMITIDNYRIGAKYQIETYGGIMDIPVFAAESHDDLKKKIAQNQDQDLIFVDTIGKSPKDFMKLAEMRSIVEACGPQAEIHLALSATTKDRDIREILDQFEPFRYKSVLLTKLDETTRVGNLISILSEKRKDLSYITDGQNVPVDISVEPRKKLLNSLVGFSCDIESVLDRLEKRKIRGYR